MTHPLHIFKIKREERWLALVALLFFVGLNALLIGSHWEAYTQGAPGGFWSLFTRRFTMSGYDCWSWITVSGLRIHFITIRHPLYLSFLYPMYLLNHWLMTETGVNFAVFMIGAVLVFSAVYTAIFMYRIFRELLSVPRNDALLLTALLFSFGHVMVPAMVPDHFVISLMLLTMTAYIAGKKLMTGRLMLWWQSALLLFFTAGIAASNGVKTLLADLFVNSRRVFRPRFVLLGTVMPLALLLGIQQYQVEAFEVPQAEAIAQMEKKNAKTMDAKQKKEIADHRRWKQTHDMKAAGTGVASLMDFSTPRLPILVEDYFGESILLHRGHALEDVLRTRPSIVRYHSWWCYAVEAFMVALLVGGLWLGRRHRLVQMLFCWFCFDVLLNLVLGFAVNEIYIMASGWLFTLPIAASFVLQRMRGKWHLLAQTALAFVVALLLGHNLTLIVQHLY